MTIHGFCSSPATWERLDAIWRVLTSNCAACRFTAPGRLAALGSGPRGFRTRPRRSGRSGGLVVLAAASDVTVTVQ